MKYSNEYAKYKICQICFIVKYDGISAIKQHLNSLKHKNEQPTETKPITS